MLDSIAKWIFVGGCILATIALVVLGSFAYQSGLWQGLGPILILIRIALIGGALGLFFIVAAMFKAGGYVAKEIDYEIERRKERKRGEQDHGDDHKTPTKQ